MCIASGEHAWGNSGESVTSETEAWSACVNARASSCAGFLKSANLDLFIRTCTALIEESGISIPRSPMGRVDGETEYCSHFQPARCSATISLLINAYSAAGSASTEKGVSGNSFNLAITSSTCSSLMTRGVIFFSSCANFNSASLARALASTIACRAFAVSLSRAAACTLDLAISACAMPRSALALAVSASNTEVRQSPCSSRIVVVRHCSSKNAIVAHAPMAVMTPPTRTPFQEIGYQYSAHSKREGSTATRVESLLFLIGAVRNAVGIRCGAFSG